MSNNKVESIDSKNGYINLKKNFFTLMVLLVAVVSLCITIYSKSSNTDDDIIDHQTVDKDTSINNEINFQHIETETEIKKRGEDYHMFLDEEMPIFDSYLDRFSDLRSMGDEHLDLSDDLIIEELENIKKQSELLSNHDIPPNKYSEVYTKQVRAMDNFIRFSDDYTLALSNNDEKSLKEAESFYKEGLEYYKDSSAIFQDIKR